MGYPSTALPDMIGAGRTSRRQGIGVRPGKEFGDRRGCVAASTGNRIAWPNQVVKCFAVNGRNWGLNGY